MKPKISLKWLLAILIPSLLIAIVFGYSMISANYFVRGMDNIISANMARAAETYIQTVSNDQRTKVNEFSGYTMSPSWDDLPKSMTENFNHAPKVSGDFLKYDPSGLLDRPDKLVFILLYGEHKGQPVEPIYIARVLTAKEALPMVGRNINHNMYRLIIYSSIVVLAVCGLLWIVYRRISQPVKGLYQWTRSLDKDNLQTDVPDFSYPELNGLAQLIQQSFYSVNESLEREQRFLRHASHELRTPISVIRSNIELARKINSKENNFNAACPEAQIVDRIDRASLTMKHLTETLLWLNRDKEDEVLAKVTIPLDQTVENLVEEMRYLLNDKSIELTVDTSPYQIENAEQPTRIVIGNLIRNAFQHTWEGRIFIRQENNQISIENTLSKTEETQKDLGFGLGLKLIDQLTQKLGWAYKKSTNDETYSVTVTIGSA